MDRQDIKEGLDVNFIRVHITRTGAVKLKEMQGVVGIVGTPRCRVTVARGATYWLLPEEMQHDGAARDLRRFLTDAIPYATRLCPHIVCVLDDLLAALKPDAKLPGNVTELRIKTSLP